MKRCLTTLVLFAVFSAIVRADVTIVQTMTMEGGAAAMGGAAMSPSMTSRVKGMKSRIDMETGAQAMTTIADLVAKEVFVLRADQKTAQYLAGGPNAVAAPADAAVGKVDGSVKPTGQSRTIDGLKCDEYTFTTSMSMADMTSGAPMPPEAAAMMKDLTMVMTGSMWVAKEVPGAAEYIAFQKALGKSDLGGLLMGGGAGKVPGLDRLVKAMSGIDGMAYLTEMNMTIDGTGQVADMMKQSGMGTMKITTKVKSISGDPLSDDLFKVPEGYTVVK